MIYIDTSYFEGQPVKLSPVNHIVFIYFQNPAIFPLQIH